MAAGPTPHARDGRPYDEMLPKAPGTFPPNPIGLYDMSGNVAEWVSDYYGEDYYKDSPVNNPKGPQTAVTASLGGYTDNVRVLRGGTYRDFIGNTTVTRRRGVQNISREMYGFRCAY